MNKQAFLIFWIILLCSNSCTHPRTQIPTMANTIDNNIDLLVEGSYQVSYVDSFRDWSDPKEVGILTLRRGIYTFAGKPSVDVPDNIMKHFGFIQSPNGFYEIVKYQENDKYVGVTNFIIYLRTTTGEDIYNYTIQIEQDGSILLISIVSDFPLWRIMKLPGN